MTSRSALYLATVAVVTACVIGGLYLFKQSSPTEMAAPDSKKSSGWTLFGGIASTATTEGKKQAAQVSVESLENAQDFYASFLAARATGRPELVYEAKTLLEGCEDGFMRLGMLRTAEGAAQPPVDPVKEAALIEGHRKMTKAIDELTRRCRGFVVVRDWRGLQKELIRQATDGSGALANLMRVEGYPPQAHVTEEAKGAIAAALRSGDRTTIELALRSLWASLFDPRRYSPTHSARLLTDWRPDRSLVDRLRQQRPTSRRH